MFSAKHEPKEPWEPQIVVHLGKNRAEYYLRVVLAPVPKYVRNSAFQLLRLLADWLGKRTYARKLRACLDEDRKDGAFVWRSLLLTGAEFKQSLRGRGYSDRLRRSYTRLQLPKYVWLFEVSFVEEDLLDKWPACLAEGQNPVSRQIVGEYLFDATCPSNDARLLSERYFENYWDHTMDRAEFLEEDRMATVYDCCVSVKNQNAS